MCHARGRKIKKTTIRKLCHPSRPVPSCLKSTFPSHVNLTLGKRPYDISMRRSQIRWFQEPKPAGKSVQKLQSAKSWVAGLISKRQHHALIVTSEARKSIPVMTRHPPHASPGQTDSFTTGPLQNTLPQSTAM